MDNIDKYSDERNRIDMINGKQSDERDKIGKIKSNLKKFRIIQNWWKRW